MQKVIHSDEWTHNGKELLINVEKDSGCYERILISIHDQLTTMLELTSKVLVYRFEVFANVKLEVNTLASDIAEEVKRFLIKKYKMKNNAYVWAREQSDDKNTHYHFALLLDGQKTRSPKATADFLKTLKLKLAEKYTSPINIKPFKRPKTKNVSNPWNKTENVSNHWKLIRHNQKQFEEMFYILSYLAKENTKINKPDKTKNYGNSRLKPTCKKTENASFNMPKAA